MGRDDLTRVTAHRSPEDGAVGVKNMAWEKNSHHAWVSMATTYAGLETMEGYIWQVSYWITNKNIL